MTDELTGPTFADVQAAAATLAGRIAATPCATSRVLSRITGAEVVLKYETQQFTGSYKERGALNRLLARSPDDPVPTVNEAGVACAIRAGVPVAVLGHDDDNPYARWTSPAFGNDPLAAGKEAIWTAQGKTTAWRLTESGALIGAAWRGCIKPW